MDVVAPISATISYIGYDDVAATTYKTYYVGEENIHRIDRVFYGTTTKHEMFLDDGYKTNLKAGMIKVLPYASSSIVFDRNGDIEIRYVPKVYNRVATYRTAEFLLEKLNTVTRGTPSKELETIQKRLKTQETILQQRIGLALSSQFRNYDSIYGVNRKKITQNFERNKYISSYGF